MRDTFGGSFGIELPRCAGGLIGCIGSAAAYDVPFPSSGCHLLKDWPQCMPETLGLPPNSVIRDYELSREDVTIHNHLFSSFTYHQCLIYSQVFEFAAVVFVCEAEIMSSPCHSHMPS